MSLEYELTHQEGDEVTVFLDLDLELLSFALNSCSHVITHARSWSRLVYFQPFSVNATVRGRVWYNLLDAPVLTLDVTICLPFLQEGDEVTVFLDLELELLSFSVKDECLGRQTLNFHGLVLHI